MAKKNQRPEHRCGDCKHFQECNEILHGELSADETFPEMPAGCVAFREKDENDETVQLL